jgi:hypothetical protein
VPAVQGLLEASFHVVKVLCEHCVNSLAEEQHPPQMTDQYHPAL